MARHPLISVVAGYLALGFSLTYAAPPEDPYLWLEEVEGKEALEWVDKMNEGSLGILRADPRYTPFFNQVHDILNAKDRIKYGTLRDGHIYNFWRDETHVRGVWQRTPLAEYRKTESQWETILDFDALAKAEKENWVYKGVDCLAPDGALCLVRLSRGGKDASVFREFDTRKKAFVENGFRVPEAKSGITWVDKDTLLLGTDWGEGSLTESGYPRVVKRWTRGTPLTSAKTVLEGKPENIGVWPWVSHSDGTQTVFITQSLTFYTSRNYVVNGDALVSVPIPDHAQVRGTFAGRLLFAPREGWKRSEGGETYPAGALLAMPLAAVVAGNPAPPITTIYTPDDRTSIEGISTTKDALYVTLIRNVKGEVLRYAPPTGDRWTSTKVPLPANGSVSVATANPFESTVLFNYEDHITPDQLLEYTGKGAAPAPLKSLPPRFDATGLVVNQHEAKSKDGERIPYFIVRRADRALDATIPTVLYGYGGFEISLTPRYITSAGKLWLERGGAYVIANIRGGGEFGPRWHRAALKENRQRAFDDFAAVAEDLIARKITSPKHLGIMGGSNGGLLMGASFTQRPDLFGAVVCQVPLLDMLRYTQLLAGASWAAEYGDPEDPKMHAVLSAYSPYHNVKADGKYPPVFFLTSTKDDRVHPAHARKMVARMKAQKHDVLYYENTEGGHAAGANLKQHAIRAALEFVFFSRRLGLD